jgi:hypothetical protein
MLAIKKEDYLKLKLVETSGKVQKQTGRSKNFLINKLRLCAWSPVV